MCSLFSYLVDLLDHRTQRGWTYLQQPFALFLAGMHAILKSIFLILTQIGSSLTLLLNLNIVEGQSLYDIWFLQRRQFLQSHVPNGRHGFWKNGSSLTKLWEIPSARISRVWRHLLFIFAVDFSSGPLRISNKACLSYTSVLTPLFFGCFLCMFVRCLGGFSWRDLCTFFFFFCSDSLLSTELRSIGGWPLCGVSFGVNPNCDATCATSRRRSIMPQMKTSHQFLSIVLRIESTLLCAISFRNDVRLSAPATAASAPSPNQAVYSSVK